MRDKELEQYRKRGIVMDRAVRVLRRDADGNIDMRRLAMDSALITSPNAGVPAWMTNFLDPRTFELPTAPLRARDVFGVSLAGKWTDSQTTYKFQEFAGKTSSYSDFHDTAASTVNFIFPTVGQYVFQTNIRYGLRENDLMSEANINYASSLQRSAFLKIEQDQNKFWLLGVDNMDIYGALNDPQLPAAITTTNDWTDTTLSPKVIQSDFQQLFLDLTSRTQSWVDQNSRMKLLVSPSVSVGLGTTSEYNQCAWDLITKWTPNVEMVVIPELDNIVTGGQAFLIAPDVYEQPTAENRSSLLFQAGPVIAETSYWKQKAWATTQGCVYYFPYGVARMTGVEG